MFNNIQYGYWSSNTVTYSPELARTFYTFNGLQNYASYKDFPHLAWAVRSGDVAVVPVPAAIWFFTSGLGLFAFNSRRKAQVDRLQY